MDIQKIRETALACYDEFSQDQKDKAFAIFEAMDSDGSGTVSLEEYEEYFGSSGRCSFQELDIDGDAQLDFEEFITLFYVMLTSKDASTTQPLIILPQDQPKSSHPYQVSKSDSQPHSQFVSRSESEFGRRFESVPVRRSDSEPVHRSESEYVSEFESGPVPQSYNRPVRRSESESLLRTESKSVHRSDRESDSEFDSQSESSQSGKKRSKREAVLNAIHDYNIGWVVGTAVTTVAAGAALCAIM